MEEQNTNQKEYLEDVLALVKMLIDKNKEQKVNDQNPPAQNHYDENVGQLPLIVDEGIIDELEQYVHFKEEENAQSKTEIEKPEIQIEIEQENELKENIQYQEKTYEEKVKWIDEVLKADDSESNNSGNDENEMLDEFIEGKNNKDDIYEMEKEFFEQVKKTEKEEYEKRQAQIEKNRKLYEEIVGDKHRRVQIIILSSTSSETSSPKNQSYQSLNDIETNQIPYQSKCNDFGIKNSVNGKNNDFVVKEEYLSEEEDSQAKIQINENKIDQEDEQEQQQQQEEELYKLEIQELFKSEFDKKNFNIREFSDIQYQEKTLNFLNNEEVEAAKESLGVPFGPGYNNDYEQELETLLDNLNFK